MLRFLVALLCLPLAACAGTRPASTPAPGAALDGALARTVAGKATGIVLVARGSRVIAVRSFAGDQGGFTPRRSTSFDLASIGKTFTAIAAVRLADLGQFDLDVPLRRYLPELPAEMEDITARNALAHDTGLPRYLEGDDLTQRSAAQALAEIAAMRRERRAGSGYYYSNLGPQLVALALERAAGEPLEPLMRRLVFAPLGLRHTHFHGDPALRGIDVAPAYADGQRHGSPAEWPSTWTMLGAAGITASADDVLRFARGIFVSDFLSRSAREALLADGVSTGGLASFRNADTLDIHYGAGLFHWRDRAGRRVHFHGGGGDFGTNVAMLWRQDDDLTVIALFNSTTDDYDRGVFFDAVLGALENPR